MPVHSRSPIFPGNGGFSAPLSSVHARDLRRRSGLHHARRLQGDDRRRLSKDPTLVAKLEAGQQTRPQPLPDACGTVAIVAQPSDANRTQADELTRRAYDAEMQGNVQEARTLLRRASDLDATNRSAAYHLGLTSETLGDRAAAVAAYCRYLSLAPTSAESAEARQRVAKLSQATTRVAAGSVSEPATNGRRAPAATDAAHDARSECGRAASRRPSRESSPSARVVAGTVARGARGAAATERAGDRRARRRCRDRRTRGGRERGGRSVASGAARRAAAGRRHPRCAAVRAARRARGSARPSAESSVRRPDAA